MDAIERGRNRATLVKEHMILDGWENPNISGSGFTDQNPSGIFWVTASDPGWGKLEYAHYAPAIRAEVLVEGRYLRKVVYKCGAMEVTAGFLGLYPPDNVRRMFERVRIAMDVLEI